MSQHVAISTTEAADRLTIRKLIDAYAHCADRRDAKGQTALITADMHFVGRSTLFTPTGAAWLFAQRLLYVDWIEERALS
jgi:hypothetical protein